MGILDFQRPKETCYVTEEAFKENLSRQVEAVTTVLGVLRKNSLSDTNLRSLEFFF